MDPDFLYGTGFVKFIIRYGTVIRYGNTVRYDTEKYSTIGIINVKIFTC